MSDALTILLSIALLLVLISPLLAMTLAYQKRNASKKYPWRNDGAVPFEAQEPGEDTKESGGSHHGHHGDFSGGHHGGGSDSAGGLDGGGGHSGH